MNIEFDHSQDKSEMTSLLLSFGTAMLYTNVTNVAEKTTDFHSVIVNTAISAAATLVVLTAKEIGKLGLEYLIKKFKERK